MLYCRKTNYGTLIEQGANTTRKGVLAFMFFYKRIIIFEIIIFLIVSFNLIKSENEYKNFMYETEVTGIAKIVSSKEEKKYTNKYVIKSDSKKFILYSNEEFEYGDVVKFKGEFKEPRSYRNLKLFNYSRYLRQLKIYGALETSDIEIIGSERNLFYYLEKLKIEFKQNLFDNFDKEQAGFLAGVLLGDKSEVLDETKQDFQDSSLSHILAISGMHIVYVTAGASFILDLICHRRKLKNILLILFLIFFAIFTGSSPSCLRACIMCIMALLAEILYRQNDFYLSLLFSLDIILLINCYNIESTGMWLSFLSTFGIVYIGSNRSQDELGLEKANLLKSNFILESFKISLASNLMILPILWNSFNKISLTFFISNFLISFIIGPIIIIGYICLFLGRFLFIFPFIEKLLLDTLFSIAKLLGNLSFSKILCPSINIYFWIIYYIVLVGGIYLYRHKEIFERLKKVIKYFVIIVSIVGIIIIIPKEKDFEIHFLDVGQGDSCLIVTPNNKTILIDGGNNENFDCGKNIVAPYLLKNGITKVDYLIVSHRGL